MSPEISRQSDKPSLPPSTYTGNSLSNFLAGAGDVWRGLGLLLRRPSWWWLVLVPFAINILLLSVLIWLGHHPLHNWLSEHFFKANAWWGILGGLIEVVFWVVIVVAVFFIFVPILTLVAAPFNDFLSEKVELDYRGIRVDKDAFVRDTWRAVWVGLKTSLRFSLTTMGLYLLILPLNLIPPFGPTLFTVLSALITIRFLALQFTAYSMDRRFYNSPQRHAFLKRHRWRSIGLGAMSFVFMLIPGLNALFIPVSAVAGTLLFCDTEIQRDV